MKRIIFVLIIFTGISACEKTEIENLPGEDVDIQKVLELINFWRSTGSDCGDDTMPSVSELQWDSELELAARRHSVDMHENSYFSHTGLDGSSFSNRINATDFQGFPAGENIASGYADEDAVLVSWMNSPGHCKNIMNGSFTHFALARSGNYWTMVFGRM